MALTFPNASRSFDEIRNVIRFTGYDGMFEVKFFVEATALLKTAPSGITESDCLRAFDVARTRVQTAAAKLYNPKRGATYTLTAADLT
jgi:hypothetical protein